MDGNDIHSQSALMGVVGLKFYWFEALGNRDVFPTTGYFKKGRLRTLSSALKLRKFEQSSEDTATEAFTLDIYAYA